jgi:hypothetical protein
MVCVLVPLLLKRKIGVLFGVLRGPHIDPLSLIVSVLRRKPYRPAWAGADHSPPASVEAQNGGAIPPLPHVSWLGS